MAFFLILALLSSGYCTAAHAFGEIPMQTAKSSTMEGMPDCSGMHSGADKTDGKSLPVKSGGMNCKLCCTSLTGFLPLTIVHQAIDHSVAFSLFNSFADSDPHYKIFHPPKAFV